MSLVRYYLIEHLRVQEARETKEGTVWNERLR